MSIPAVDFEPLWRVAVPRPTGGILPQGNSSYLWHDKECEPRRPLIVCRDTHKGLFRWGFTVDVRTGFDQRLHSLTKPFIRSHVERLGVSRSNRGIWPFLRGPHPALTSGQVWVVADRWTALVIKFHSSSCSFYWQDPCTVQVDPLFDEPRPR